MLDPVRVGVLKHVDVTARKQHWPGYTVAPDHRDWSHRDELVRECGWRGDFANELDPFDTSEVLVDALAVYGKPTESDPEVVTGQQARGKLASHQHGRPATVEPAVSDTDPL
jgi:hypothetical protein